MVKSSIEQVTVISKVLWAASGTQYVITTSQYGFEHCNMLESQE